MDKSTIKISVIIPVYNTEDYVEEAIKSITNQTLQDLEIIVINDGSTDNSLSVVERMASADDRITVLSQENQGQGIARNRGLDIAKGEYIYFMDSDDILDTNALKICYYQCDAEKLDFVFFDAQIFGDENKLFDPNYYKRTNQLTQKVYRGYEIMNILIERKKFRIPMWLYLINRNYLNKIGLKLLSTWHEDETFTTLLYAQAQRVNFIAAPFFNRRVRPNSVMTNKITENNVKGYLNAALTLKTFADKSEKETKQAVENYLSKMLNAAIRRFHVLPPAKKLSIAKISILKYGKYLKIKTLIILLLK